MKTLLQQGIPEPVFYLVYKLKRTVGKCSLSDQLKLIIIKHYNGAGYNMHVMQQFACLVIYPITISSLIARQ